MPEGYSDVSDIIQLIREPEWVRRKLDERRAIELNGIICQILAIDQEQESALADKIRSPGKVV